MSAHSIEAEMSVLGAILIDPEIFSAIVSTGLTADDFHFGSHGEIFNAIRRLSDSGRKIDAVLLGEELRLVGMLEGVGGVAGLTDLASAVMTTAYAEHHAKMLIQLSGRRKFAIAGMELIDRSGTDDMEDLAANLEQQVQDAIKRSKGRKGTPSLGEILRAVFQNIEQAAQFGQRGLVTGFPQFDNMIGNMRPSQLLIVGARPGVGKTAFLLDVTRFMARAGVSVGVCSLEMPADELVLRMVASASGVDHMRLLKAELYDHEWPKLIAGASGIRGLPIVIEDSPLTLSEFRARAKFMVKEQGCRVIMLDYLQLVKNKIRDGAREREVAEVSVACKEIAKELRVPVMAMAQLNRNLERRDKEARRPQLSDLRESGSIENDADVVAFLHRNPIAEVEADRERSELVIAKNRHGPTGIINLTFHSKITSFEETSPTAEF